MVTINFVWGGLKHNFKKLVVHSLSRVQLFATAWTIHSVENSPGQNTGVGSLSLLQGNLPNPEIEPRSPIVPADS